MKQIPQNFNHQMPFQPRGSMMPWSPYQQVVQQAPMQSAPVAQSTPKKGLTGLLSKLNPANGNLSQTLDQIHQFIKMGQSFSPKIQEYAPLIKSLPAMLELMNEFDDEDEDNDSTDDANDDSESTAELDAILGIDEEDSLDIEEHEDDDQDELVDSSSQVKTTKKNRNNDLFKIETMDREHKNEYKKPKLYI